MNGETIETWFELYANDVFNYLVYYTYSHDVEDLVQETFIKAWTHLGKQNKIVDPKAWLLSIARNTAIDAMRKMKRPIENTIGDDLLRSLESDFSVEERVELNEEKRQIISALLALKQSYREVVILRSLEDFSIRTTAQILGWSESKVKTTYFRAIKRIQYSIQGGVPNGLVR